MSASLFAAFEARFGHVFNSSLEAPNEAALLRMTEHRSIRRYQDKPVPVALLNTILLATQSAPTKSDLQQYSIIIVRDPNRRARIASLAGGDPWIAKAPLMLIFCADLHRMRRVCEHHGRPYQNDNLDSFMNAAVDTGIALATCIVASESQGLGCCPLSVIRNQIDATSELLCLPDAVFPIAALGLGYPAEEPAISMRLPRGLVVHDEQYDDCAFGQAISIYDNERRARQPIANSKQRHSGRFGIDPKITWSANAARQMAVAERAGFRAWLNSRGLKAS